ncbi:MAG: aspartate--tRNA ligase [Clostridiales Family XIII bacterium]|jgi:aspartyl-tRNA synthetase|nr:aspartate--tRNA ligase [Clostridiales Family XIII bacterium]
MSLLKRTNYCGEARISDVGSSITVNGWVQRSRRLGALIFTDLRDKTGIIQVVFDEDVPEAVFASAETLRNEFVVGVSGTIRERESKNGDIPTGEVEILAKELVIYSEAETPPIYIKDDDNVDENLRLKYRYLDLRKQKMQNNLSFRADVCRLIRNYYADNGFTEVETPVLIAPTPEGARDYLVPSRVHPKNFYALPQSPQMYKQLLMAGGTDRYFQIVKCFRDEDLRADRQPEFTQVDLEMSFVEEDDVIEIQEGFIKKLMKQTKNIDVKLPLPRLTYEEAMNRYGSDKPDTRFKMELIDVSDRITLMEHRAAVEAENSEEGVSEGASSGFVVFSNAIASGGSVRGIVVDGGSDHFSRKDLDKLTDTCKAYGAKGLMWMRIKEDGVQTSFSKFYKEDELRHLASDFGARKGDLILISADTNKVVFATLGFLRCEIAKRLDLIDKNRFDFLWVVEFPLFEKDEETGELSAMHHPFTSPNPDDVARLVSDPLSVRAQAYDIVLNGSEIGGGSIRIHDKNLQAKMFEALGLSPETTQSKFGFLLEAFRYGVPPHGGLAYGLDRLVMILLGEDSIRETIAFPKNQAAEDPVSGAPSAAEPDALAELGIRI